MIGATQREDGPSDPGAVSAGGVYQLLRDAQVLLPAVAELELLEATARARPGTPDNAPLLGRVAGPDGPDIAGLIIATGFFRHGVLLTPVAAADLPAADGRQPDPRWDRFRPDRFSSRSRDARPATQPAGQPQRKTGTSMNIRLNGAQHTVADGATVSALVGGVTGRELAADGRATDGRKLGVAVARNAEVVPRSQWHATALAEGDDVELVTAVQGG